MSVTLSLKIKSRNIKTIKNILNNKTLEEKYLYILLNNPVLFIFTDCKNDALSWGTFPDNLKFANITPVQKKDEATDKENHRSVSVLPLFPKIFEKVIYDQPSQYLGKYLNSLLCGFWKTHSSVRFIASKAKRIR